MAAPFKLSEARGESRAKFLRTVARHHREKDRQKLRALREQIAEVKKRKAGAMRLVVSRCRSRRREIAKAVKEFRARERERINREVEAMRKTARDTCEARKQAIRLVAKTEEQKTRETLGAERALQRELRETERHLRRRDAASRLTAAEKRAESDAEVARNIDEELLPIWQQVKRGIQGTDKISRSEAFLQWVEENPAEIVAFRDRQAADDLKKLLREQKAAETEARRRSRRKRPSKAEIDEYLKDVPF